MSNGPDRKISGESLLKVHLASKWDQRASYHSEDSDDDYLDSDDHSDHGLIPESFPLDFSADLSNGVDGLPSHIIEFQGRSPPDFKQGAQAQASADLPSLKPNERAGGRCETYSGSVCAKYVGNEQIFVSKGLSQEYIEQKLRASFEVITRSSDLTGHCAEFAIPAICYSTLPLCDRQTQKPRRVSHIYVRVYAVS